MDPVAKLLVGIDDDIAACRAWGHEWPSRKLRPGRKLPRGFRPRAAPGGCVEITETCTGCGKQRITLTKPGGVYDRDVVRRYVDPANWEVIRHDEHITPRDFQGEVFRRLNEDILLAANANAGPEPEADVSLNGHRPLAPQFQQPAYVTPPETYQQATGQPPAQGGGNQ